MEAFGTDWTFRHPLVGELQRLERALQPLGEREPPNLVAAEAVMRDLLVEAGVEPIQGWMLASMAPLFSAGLWTLCAQGKAPAGGSGTPAPSASGSPTSET